jgi:sterol desaturase/sphingolipid hydroxylase (fatty acid hydroxylase superfamily)
MSILTESGATVGAIFAGMALVAWIETVVPLHLGERASRAHVRTNLALTFLNVAANLVLNLAVLAALAGLSFLGLGLLNMFPQSAGVTLVVVVLALDLSFYLAHVAMHKIPAFWRYHRVHHSDPVVDVTTTVRQHPGESVIRYAFMAAFAFALGAPAGAVAVYRTWSALNGLLEHANIRIPHRLDRLLSLVTTWPCLHKVHHSRWARETDTNYGNILSLWDRLFFTFTPSSRGFDIPYGLDGFDDAATQSISGLLRLPFRPAAPAPRLQGGTKETPAWP